MTVPIAKPMSAPPVRPATSAVLPWVVTQGGSVGNKIRAAVVAEPKCGKTRFISSLPWGEEPFGDKALYVAWDSDSEFLSSVLTHNRDHLVVVKPQGTLIDTPKGPSLKFDPHSTAHMIASRRWKEELGVDSIIWDTMSATAYELLRAYANTGVFQGSSGDKHITIGSPGDPWYMATPMMGDYGLAQQAVLHILKALFNQPLNVIVAFHMDGTDPDKGPVVLGPRTVGSAAVRTVAGEFANLFRISMDNKPLGGTPPKYETSLNLYTQKIGSYLGGIRTPHGSNPIPQIAIPEDPVEVWRKIARVMRGE